MYVELGGQRYALDSVLTQGGLALLFADTPVEDVDALACALPDVLRIYAAGSGALLYEFQGFKQAVELRKNPASRQVLLRLRRDGWADRP